MTTKPKARKFRIRPSQTLSSGDVTIEEAQAAMEAAEAATEAEQPVPRKSKVNPARASAERAAAPQALQEPASPPAVAATDMDALKKEGLTGRQLRMARRLAQKQGLAVTSDFDAVRQLREMGIDPFQRSNVLELVVPKAGQSQAISTSDPAKLPQTTPAPGANLPAVDTMAPAERRAMEIGRMQADMAKRRRRKTGLLFTRLAMFVLLPTLVAGWYFYVMATPMYATHSEFVVQQADGQGGAAGLGGLFTGTAGATQSDSSQVQSYLASIAAMVRLDEDHGFIDHFSDENIDAVQRLPEEATNNQAFEVYQDRVRVSYDPTEGIIRMEVVAADPQVAQTFAEALIGYAEDRQDQATQRLREDQMAGARESYEQAEGRRDAALAELLRVQQQVQQIDPAGETAARIQQISALESQRQELQVSLQQRLNVSSPNEAQVNALISQIESIDALISQIRSEMTAVDTGQGSLAANNIELRRAEENYVFETGLVQQALAAMETARIEANRQVRYLFVGVEPIAPDEAAYPRAFENTALAFLVFAGIYLMISLTSSILREQVSG